MEVKEEILSLLSSVDREGMDSLVEWLKGSSFFKMPASTRFHGNYEGGLAEHSLNVFHSLEKLCEMYQKQFPETSFDRDSLIICALCHDFCKVDVYKKSFRNVKNAETGAWEKKECYEYSDPLGMGHGEGSLYMLQSFIPLKRSEALAIRWHMGEFDSAVRGGDRSINVAQNQTPLVTLLHMADQWSSYFMEETLA